MLINFYINHKNFGRFKTSLKLIHFALQLLTPKKLVTVLPAPTRLLPVCQAGALGSEKLGVSAVPPTRDTAPSQPPHLTAPAGISRFVSGSQWEAGGTEPPPSEPLALRKGLKISF